MASLTSTLPARCVAVLLAAGAAAAVRAEPHRFELDPAHLSIGFLVDHVGYARTLGLFRKASGSFVFDEATGRLSDLQVVVDTASVFTNHEERDRHLRGKDFLNVARFPRMTFTARSARRTGERTFLVEGQLELLGQKRPLALEATWNSSGEYPFGGGLLRRAPYAMGVSARGTFRRSAHGMTYGVQNGWVGDEIELVIELEARRQ